MTENLDLVCGRRAALIAAGAAGSVVLAACGSADSVADGASGAVGSATDAVKQAIKEADIPVGGGKVVDALGVVVTQPTAGEFKAFSNVCTHQGGRVNEVKDGTIRCPLHGSRFRITDGSVAQGPAIAPLPAKKVTVSADGLTIS